MNFVLIHSPVVGALTWQPTARLLREQGHISRVPVLDIASAHAPYWPSLAGRVAEAARDLAPEESLVLVTHSAAGLIVPAVRNALPERAVRAYVFVDAALPENGVTLGDLIPAAAGVTMDALRARADDGWLPPLGADWPEAVWAALIPDTTLRARFVAEVPRVPLALYDDPTPIVATWPDAPCCYLQFSRLYATTEARARESGWETRQLRGEHFHMLVKPLDVARALVDLAEASQPSSGARPAV
jgi:hypothetical protein